MGKAVGKVVSYLIVLPIILYVMHLFTVGGFGTPLGMIVDDALIVDAPPGKEFGWVPVVLEVEMLYGKWQTDLFFLDTEKGSIHDY